jgi:hypothetical protein
MRGMPTKDESKLREREKSLRALLAAKGAGMKPHERRRKRKALRRAQRRRRKMIAAVARRTAPAGAAAKPEAPAPA